MVALVIAIIGCFLPVLPGGKSVFGNVTGETNYNVLGVSGLKIGSNCNSSFSSTAANGCKSTTHFIATSCNLIGTDASQAASTTLAYDCAVTGVTSSDTVIAQLSTTTQNSVIDNNTTAGPWAIYSAKASTTAGFVTVRLHNGGLAAIPSVSSVGSSTAVLIFQ